MPSRGTMPRAIRIPDDLWARAKARAERDGVTITSVVIEALQRFVDRK